MAEVLAGLDQVYSTGLFESCWLEAESAERGIRLAVNVREAQRRTAELGLSYDEADGVSGFLRLRNRDLFGWGQQATVAGLASEGEAGVRADLRGDRLWQSGVGYWLEASAIDERPLLFSGGESLGRAEFDRDDVTLGLQGGAGSSVLARLGLTVGRAEVQSRPGLGLPAARDSVRRLAATLAWDDLDDRDLPSSGARLRLTAERSLGSTRDHWRIQTRGEAVLPLASRVLLQGRFFVGLSGRDVPTYELFRIGGPALVPGLHRDELWGRQALGLSLGPTLIVSGFRLCLRTGAGEVWRVPRDITLRSLKRGVGIGLEKATRFGPLVLDVGVAESGRTAFHLSAGFR
jgi:outer membrane protein assembly factor BamA